MKNNKKEINNLTSPFPTYQETLNKRIKAEKRQKLLVNIFYAAIFIGIGIIW